MTDWITLANNWLNTIVMLALIYFGIKHVIVPMFDERIDRAIAKLDDKMKVMNRLRNLH